MTRLSGFARLGQRLRHVAYSGWARIQPSVVDGANWLVYRAPGALARWLGRVLWWILRRTPRGFGSVLWWALLGLVFLARHAARYCIGYRDFAAVVQDARDRDKPRQERVWRERWRQAALRRTITILSALTVLISGAITAVDYYGGLVETGIIMVVVVILSGIGRATRPVKAAVEKPAEETSDDPRAPFPLADARTRAEAAEAVTRALAAEGIELRHCEDPARATWGWTVPVVLRAGTPAGIVGKAGEVETHLDLPAGGVLASPDLSRRARVVLRLVQHDAFAHLAPALVRQPGSGLITQRAVIGASIDGRALAVPLLGVHGVVIGSPGSGKTTTLLQLADAVAACDDALVWDLDPAGDGLRSLGAAVGLRQRGHADTETALTKALAYAQARLQLAGERRMPRGEWQPTRDHPAVVVFVDEYPQLTTKAKHAAVDLLRVGRKARITLFLAATEATSDALGAAIATTTGLRLLHACRPIDIQLVLGPGKAAEGWRPDRLHAATADTPGDAGCCYVSTGGYREPLLSKINPLDLDETERHGDQRAAAGLPAIDEATVYRAGLVEGGTVATATGERKPLWDAWAVFGDNARLWTEDLLARLAMRDPETYGSWSPEQLAAVFREVGITPVQIWRDGRNRRGYLRNHIEEALQKGGLDTGSTT